MRIPEQIKFQPLKSSNETLQLWILHFFYKLHITYKINGEQTIFGFHWISCYHMNLAVGMQGVSVKKFHDAATEIS